MARTWRDSGAWLLGALAFDAGVLWWAWRGGFGWAALGWLHVGVASAIAFAAMGIDKALAVRGRRRISEAALWWLALLGGAMGALMAMSLFRHKQSKGRFRFGVPLVVFVHLLLLASGAGL